MSSSLLWQVSPVGMSGVGDMAVVDHTVNLPKLKIELIIKELMILINVKDKLCISRWWLPNVESPRDARRLAWGSRSLADGFEVEIYYWSSRSSRGRRGSSSSNIGYYWWYMIIFFLFEASLLSTAICAAAPALCCVLLLRNNIILFYGMGACTAGAGTGKWAANWFPVASRAASHCRRRHRSSLVRLNIIVLFIFYEP